MNLSRNGKPISQACAACKYQRKKCVPDCILAPYFPHDRQRQFLNAHKLFGVSNITKMVKHLHPLEKDEAMRTIIFQSDVRATDPVGGCYRIICDLHTQIEYSRTELDLVLQQLAIFRAQARQQNQQPHPPQQMYTTQPTHHTTAPVNYSADRRDHIINNADQLSLYNPTATSYHSVQQPREEQYGTVQHSNCNSDDNSQSQVEDPNSWAVQNKISTLSMLSLHGNSAVSDQYENRALLSIPSYTTENPRYDITEDFQTWSDEGVLFKLEDGVLINAGDDSSHQVQDHDLKGAATLFTLTNSNS